MVDMRLLDFDENISLRGETLQKAIDEDRENGKIPIYVNECLSVDPKNQFEKQFGIRLD